MAETPTQYLIMEVLLARMRTGESFWTFPKKPAIVKAANELEKAHRVWTRSGPVEGHFQIWPTEVTKYELSQSDYIIPILRS